MTVAGDVGSGTGTEPMVKIGAEPMRRKLPNNKKEKKKMKKFREYAKEMSESPVGMVGRTKDSEALAHIEGSDLAKEFRKIVKKLGGKNVARQLLSGMRNSGAKAKVDGSVDEAKTMSPNKFIIDLGYKIKDEKFEKHGFEIEFYSEKDCKEAYKDLVKNGFLDYYNMTSAGKLIGFEDA